MTRQTASKNTPILGVGISVFVMYPNSPAKPGKTTSEVKYGRVGVAFDNGSWGYVHVDFVKPI